MGKPGRPKGSKDSYKRKYPKGEVQTNEGENRKYLYHNLELAALGSEKLDFADPEAVEERIQAYFQTCARNDMKPGVAGFALACGVDRRQIPRWAQGESFPGADKSRRLLLQAYQILNSQMEDYMQNGKINPIAGIFLMKNNMGYEDKVEQVVTARNPLGVEASQEELRKKYLDTVDPQYIEAPKEAEQDPVPVEPE